MKKKSQITVFMVLGIFIFLLITGLHFIVSNIGGNAIFQSIGDAEAEFKAGLQGCLKIAGEEALKKVSLHGRINAQDGLAYRSVKVYYAEPAITKQQMEQEISGLVNDNFRQCSGEIASEFEKRGLKIKNAEPAASAALNENDVSISANYPISFSFGQESRQFGDFIENYNVRLLKMLSIAEKVSIDYKNMKKLNMTYLSNIGMDTVVFPYETALLIVLEDQESGIRELNYAYSFAVKE